MLPRRDASRTLRFEVDLPANQLGPGWSATFRMTANGRRTGPTSLREPTQKERGIIAVRCAVDSGDRDGCARVADNRARHRLRTDRFLDTHRSDVRLSCSRMRRIAAWSQPASALLIVLGLSCTVITDNRGDSLLRRIQASIPMVGGDTSSVAAQCLVFANTTCESRYSARRTVDVGAGQGLVTGSKSVKQNPSRGRNHFKPLATKSVDRLRIYE